MADNEWKPSKKQALFLSLPYTIREAAYAGGAGSGKTDLLLIYPLVHKFHEDPEFKQVFLRKTYPEIRDEIVPRSAKYYRPFGATLNQSSMTWTFPSNARVILGHCQNDDDVHRYDSTQINLFTPDEATSLTEWKYLYISLERVRSSTPRLPAITRCCAMPGNIGHTWFKKRFVDPCAEGGKVILGKGGRKRFYIHSTLLDNPGVDPNYKQNLLALPDGAERRAKLGGDWDAFLGSVFDEFRDHKYPDEPDNALHVIEPFNIPEWWPRIVVGDWGFAAMTWVGFGAIAPNGRLYIYRELAWRKTKISVWAPIIREFIDRENPRLIKFCKSAGQDRGQEQTIQQQIENELGRTIELSNHSPGSRIAGKTLIHEYLRFEPKYVPKEERDEYNDDYAMWLFRNRGLKEYNAYLASFIESTPENNIPRLQIFNTCPILIDAIKACTYDTKRVEDIAEFDGDDPIDGLRYMVDTADQFVSDAESEFNRIKREEELIQQLAKTNNWTAFYRSMEKVESDSNTLQSVARYRRR